MFRINSNHLANYMEINYEKFLPIFESTNSIVTHLYTGSIRLRNGGLGFRGNLKLLLLVTL